MKPKMIFTLVVLVVAAVVMTWLNRNSGLLLAEASLNTARGTEEAYLKSLETPYWLRINIVIITAVFLAILWFKELRSFVKRLFVPAVLLLSLALVGCQPQVSMASRNPSEVMFVVDTSTAQEQVTLGVNRPVAVPADGQTPDEAAQAASDAQIAAAEAFWTNNLAQTQDVRIGKECVNHGVGVCNLDRDLVRVITVDTRSVNVSWVAPAVTTGAPLPDMTEAFSVQSLEPNGGSTGVYVGAQIIARVKPEDAALYLANYGYSSKDPGRNVYPARSLTDVIKNEVRVFIQNELTREYGSRSVVEQNADMSLMFDNVATKLVAHFARKGITIESFGPRDGHVYENPEIQRSIDSAFERQRQLEEVQAQSTRSAISNQTSIENANAEATRTIIQAQAQAEAQRLQAEALKDNPGLLWLTLAQRWNGQLPQVVGGQDPLSVFPIGMPTPAAPTN